MSEPPPLIDLLLSRRSVATLVDPGPTRAQLRALLLSAGAVPDHGLLRPFRFVVAEGDGRARFGDALAAAAAEHSPALTPPKLEGVRAKAFRSPTIVVLVASPKPGKVTAWEQFATAACAGYAIVLAAHAMAIGAIWKSVPFTRGRALTDALGLQDHEEMLGWIHLGSATSAEAPAPRPPLALEEITTVLGADGRTPYPGPV